MHDVHHVHAPPKIVTRQVLHCIFTVLVPSCWLRACIIHSSNFFSYNAIMHLVASKIPFWSLLHDNIRSFIAKIILISVIHRVYNTCILYELPVGIYCTFFFFFILNSKYPSPFPMRKTKYTCITIQLIISSNFIFNKLLFQGLTNLYGVFPYYISMENDGNANGVFLLNSNAMGMSTFN